MTETQKTTDALVIGYDGLPRVGDPHGPLWLDAKALTRELNKRRQNGDLISELDVVIAMRAATGTPL